MSTFGSVVKVGLLGAVVAWAGGLFGKKHAVTIGPGAGPVASGPVSFALPAGASGWKYATKTTASTGTTEIIFATTSPSEVLEVNMASGNKVDLDWVDSAGAAQHSTYTAS